ncbi:MULTISPECIES: bifunctional diguanylate cyclase/phosphodiesterase [unclassified Janthinobacterium]|uniref:putative bifunctional diguanylate cyclase/phosphodiesterase n=1 Tax=unclassified Janthinobacterium TaxID=2610881 RepID=UPI0016187183|nr:MULTISPECIES: GGDEF domain-containing phosphodiesterase [unclassified Janthinobacterium]MBB5370504.1 diguanylate cyclase (GGDEF)-like protein [Janthinobacterium sp. K2C7]MBB5383282.1 diguanylate cyclase (GGDEF)-like protein [Janthinobacterium sp. K2Li3]MBB5388736.1 diguanylate cyclase (GGDEF)-like protein [Janthinobacterium sp. K2E3]
MGSYSRLFIPISLLIISVSAVRYQALLNQETALATSHYQSEARQLDLYLANTVLPLAVQTDLRSVPRVLRSALPLNHNLSSIRWDNAGEHTEVLPDTSPEEQLAASVPAWFARLTGITAINSRLTVALPGGQDAILDVHYRPDLPLLQVWNRVRHQAVISAINITLIFVLLSLILASHRKLLARLTMATERFRSGDFTIRMADGATPEEQAVSRSFNSMAGDIGNMLSSLQASQKRLGEQLNETVHMQKALQKMSWQNYNDVLTGLPNRAALAARFEQELFISRERQRLLAVCLFDLDHFQSINDRHGAEAGDEILKQVAARLHDFTGQVHYAARLGGDEFVMLLCGQASIATIEQNVTLLMQELSRPYQCDQQALHMTASAGIAVYAGKELNAESLLRQADHAAYQAKLTGRNQYHFFDTNLDEEVRTHHNQRTEVRHALINGELRLYYQPKVNMRAGTVVGMEALLRWQHPRRGVLAPAQFLPLVEQTDLIIDIGEWVLRQALWQMQRWIAAGQHWVVSVNIAARHFQQPDFVSRLKTILGEFPGVRPSMLELEILESSALHDIEHVRRIIRACQALGITFALDDFGTGYSSMSYLKRLPANIVKIDQSFVRNMLNDHDDLHLVRAVIGLARSFSLTVIAEGVESIEHGARLIQLGCDLAQGYGIARPMPADAVLDWAANFVPAPQWRVAQFTETPV